MNTQIQLTTTKTTYQDIETALIAVVKAGIYYKKPKDGKFMLRYKQRILNIRQAEDPEKFILESAQKNIPNEIKYQQIIDNNKTWYKSETKILAAITNLYNLYYELAKDYFLTEEQVNQQAEDFLNL